MRTKNTRPQLERVCLERDMQDQTAKPIPTQLNIAPRGKTWKNWRLVEGEDGFPTRESMEKYLCNPERVRELEECRALQLETIDRLNALLETSKCQGTHTSAGTLAKIQEPATFQRGQRVRKKSGSEWQGIIVGEYSTSLTPEGYAVESETHKGSVQIYPAKALELVEAA